MKKYKYTIQPSETLQIGDIVEMRETHSKRKILKINHRPEVGISEVELSRGFKFNLPYGTLAHTYQPL